MENTFTEEALVCLLSEAAYQIQKLAWRKIFLDDEKPEELILFCVDTKSKWLNLANSLDPKQTRSATERAGSFSLILGCANLSFYERLQCSVLTPAEIEHIQSIKIEPGKVKYLVFTKGEVDIREVTPCDQERIQ